MTHIETMEEGQPVALQLRSLAKKIREGHEDVDARMKRLRDSASSIVVTAALVGADLIEAKKRVEYGNWESYVEEDCGMTPRHASNYVALAKYWASHPEIENEPSLRAAMLLVRQDPEGARAEPKPPETKCIERAGRLAEFLDENPLDGWQEHDRNELRTALVPVVRRLWPDLLPGKPPAPYAPPHGRNLLGGEA